MKLLIVDDYPTNLRLLRAALEAEGHSVVEAPDGVVALQRLRSEPVDAIISDVLMPGMDGFRLCNEVRKSPDLCALPLILYTSTYNSPTDRSLAASVGADAYILKPAPVKELLDAIAAASAGASREPTKPDSAMEHSEILERYNAVLVRKLESRNHELATTLTSLNAAHQRILDLNRTLESRVTQRTAALDATNRELEAFSFTVSHDLRAPLRQMSVLAGLMKEELIAGTATDMVASIADRILVSTANMDALIGAMLEFARTARAQLNLVDTDLEVVLEEALAKVQPDAGRRDISWRRTRLPHALGDALLLGQVFVNLLSNAIKYSRGRAPAIIEVGPRDGRTGEIVIFVRDNGAGFDMHRAGDLFGVFKRLHDSSKFEGTGVGLATAHRIVTRHGGAIWADAAVDEGATFYFSLRSAET